MLNKLSPLLNFIKENKLPLIAITLLTLVVWHPLINQTFFGEGYYYFDRGQDFISQNGNIAGLSEYDIFARITFDVLPPIFKDNIMLYMAFQLATMVVLNLTFYYFVIKNLDVIKITEKKLFAFSSTIFFLASYVGIFEMLGTGNYQRFVQRVPNLIFLLFSIVLFIEYLHKKNARTLIYSFILFTLAMYLAHFSTFLTPFYLIYALIFSLHQKKFSFKETIKNISAAIPFIIINEILISGDHLKPTNHLSDWLNHFFPMVKNILLQFGALNIPPSLIEKIASITNPYENTVLALVVPILFIYIVEYFVLRKLSKKLAIFYLSSFITIFVLLVLNTYIGKIDPLFDFRGYHYYFLPPYYSDAIHLVTNVKGDRYYLVPMFFISISWSLILWSILNKLKVSKKAVFGIIITAYVVYNTHLIWGNFDKLTGFSEETKSYVNYVVSLSPTFKEDTTLVVPTYFLWPSSMIRVFHGYPGINFVALKPGWETQLAQYSTKNVIIIDYNYKTKQFINLSEDYKNNKPMKFLY